MPGETFDASSEPSDGSTSNRNQRSATQPEGAESRRYIGVRFDCCATYTRIYINAEETAYVGNCPRCGKQVRLRIGPDGTDARFFSVS